MFLWDNSHSVVCYGYILGMVYEEEISKLTTKKFLRYKNFIKV